MRAIVVMLAACAPLPPTVHVERRAVELAAYPTTRVVGDGGVCTLSQDPDPVLVCAESWAACEELRAQYVALFGVTMTLCPWR